MSDIDMGPSNFGKALDIYNPANVVAMCISILFLFLFFIIQSIELNKIYTDFGLTNSVLSAGRLIYIYSVGYFIFIIKFLIALITFMLLIGVITIIIVLPL